MTHPIVALQAVLVAAWREELTVFDAPAPASAPPYAVIARHDLLPRDGDAADGFEHRLLLHAWAADASRKAVVTLAGRLIDITLSASLDSDDLRVTLRRHERTDTTIDAATGRARAAVSLTFFSEPNS